MRRGSALAQGGLDLLLELLAVGGPAGAEGPAAAVVRRCWGDLADAVGGDAMGNVWALRGGTEPAPRPRLVLAAHLDVIGLQITACLPGGFLRFAGLGGIDGRCLPGRQVMIAGRSPVPAVVCAPPPTRPGIATIEDMALDTGLPDAELAAAVRPGDRAHFATAPMRLLGDRIAGSGLDNRAGVAALHEALGLLGTRQPPCDLVVVANVQEELGLRGIGAVLRQLRPAAVLIVDTGFGGQPGADEHRTLACGGGPALAVGPGLHPAVGELLELEAARLDIPLQREVIAGPSGTDAWAAQVAAGPAAVGLLSIPLRSMHTTAETVDYADVRGCAELLAAFVAAASAEWVAGLAPPLAGMGTAR